MYKEIDGNLITLSLNGEFDVISHGCNCFCTMRAGIAPQMVNAFHCNTFPLEYSKYSGDINKLGQIDYKVCPIVVNKDGESELSDVVVVNSYTQYHYGKNHTDGVDKPVDYDAITLCMRKINRLFKGQHIGLPKIGAGLALSLIHISEPTRPY